MWRRGKAKAGLNLMGWEEPDDDEAGQFFGVCISKRCYRSAPRKMAEKRLSWIYGSIKKDVQMNN